MGIIGIKNKIRICFLVLAKYNLYTHLKVVFKI